MKSLTSASKPTPANLLEMTKNLNAKFGKAVTIETNAWTYTTGNQAFKYRIWIDSDIYHRSDIESFQDLFSIYCDLLNHEDPVPSKESLLEQKADDKLHAMKDEGEI